MRRGRWWRGRDDGIGEGCMRVMMGMGEGNGEVWVRVKVREW